MMADCDVDRERERAMWSEEEGYMLVGLVAAGYRYTYMANLIGGIVEESEKKLPELERSTPAEGEVKKRASEAQERQMGLHCYL